MVPSDTPTTDGRRRSQPSTTTFTYEALYHFEDTLIGLSNTCISFFGMSLSFSHSPNASKATSRPFKVNIPDDDLQRLKTLLGAAPLGVETWENKQTDGKFGVSRVWLANARSVWLNDFDWRRNEAEINSFPHFRHVVEHAELGKFDVHFCALFSKAPDAIPMVMLHGWPGAYFAEWQR